MVDKAVEETMQEVADVDAQESGRAVMQQEEEDDELEEIPTPEVDEEKETVPVQ